MGEAGQKGPATHVPGLQVFDDADHVHDFVRRLHCACSTWRIDTDLALTQRQDLFPYAVIVPVMPFALTSRAGVPQEQGNANPCALGL